jgi:hypothetical protein
MSSIVRWTAGLIVVAMLVAGVVSILNYTFDGDWGSAVLGVVALMVLVGATVKIRNRVH